MILENFLKIKKELDRFDGTAPLSDAWTPPASWYTDPHFYQLEKHHVLQKSWHFLSSHHRLKKTGDFVTEKILDKSIILCLDPESKLRAFYNVCAHHGTCVAKGEGHQKEFVCPYHGWTYDLSGKLKKAPQAGAIQDLREKNLNLKEIRLELFGPLCALNFSADAPSLDQWGMLKKIMDKDFSFSQLKHVAEKKYKMNCNWKVFVDNYLDGGYHVAHMHPRLASQLDLSSYYSELFSNFSIQRCHSDKNEAGRLSGHGALYAWLYPHFMINLYGSWMDTNLVIPTGVDSCDVIFQYYYLGDIGAEQLTHALEQSHQVQVEDTEICDMVQAGLNSGVYEKGIYAPHYEAPMYAFHQLLKSDLLGIEQN